MYIARLDAEKAYDSLWRTGLFFKLFEKMNRSLWFSLYTYYSYLNGVLRINNKMSDTCININSGVKQGGILSPSLFNFYINQLVESVLQTGYGCKIAETNVSVLAYCDDLILLSPSLNSLKKNVDLCVKYSKDWLFKFNSKKSVIMNCGKKIYSNDQIDIFIDNNRLPAVEFCKYLGININEKK